MLKYLIFFIASGFFCSIAAQNFRFEPISSDFLSIASDGGSVVAVGTNGVAMTSADYGIAWRHVNLPTLAALLHVDVMDERIVIASADKEIFYSNNRGATWHKEMRLEHTPVVAFNNEGNILAVDDKGVLSVFDGKSWSILGSLGLGMPMDLQRSNGDSLLFVNNDGLTLLTENGAKSVKTLKWIAHGFTTKYRLQKLGNSLWGFQSDTILALYNSNGNSSDSIVLKNFQMPAMFVNPNTFVELTRVRQSRSSSLLATVNAFPNNTAISSQLVDSSFYNSFPDTYTWNMPDMTSFTLLDNGDCIVAGIGKTLYRYDRNQVWSQISMLNPMSSGSGQSRYMTISHSSPHLQLCRSLGAYYKSLDNGVIWNTLKKPALDDAGSASIFFLDNQLRAWALSSYTQHFVLRSNAGIDSFARIQIYPATTGELTTGSFLPIGNTSMLGIVNSTIDAGQYRRRSHILRSVDDGNTWTFNPLYFDSTNIGTPVDVNGILIAPFKRQDIFLFNDSTWERDTTIYRGCGLLTTNDAFVTYSTIHCSGIEEITSLKFFDQNNAIAAGRFKHPHGNGIHAMLAKTNDGGNTWTPLEGDTTFYGISMAVSATNRVYAVCHTLAEADMLYIVSDQSQEYRKFTLPTHLKGLALLETGSDTLLGTTRFGEMYRIVLSPTVSVDEPSVDDFETPVYLQTPYPNPATGLVNIPYWRYAATVKPQDVQILCYSLNGTLIENIPVEPNYADDGFAVARWNAANIPPGAYLLKIETKQRKGNVKLFIKR